MQDNKSNHCLEYFFVSLGYLILALIFTYPLVANFASAISGWQSMNDGELFLWNFWWVKTALFNLHVNPFYTHFIYLPFDANLTMHTLTLFPSLISAILQHFIHNLIAVYNILFIGTFIASGLGTYILVNYLVKNKYVAFIGGMAFAFCPYVFSHAYAGHFNLINTWSLPFYLYFFLQIFEKKQIKYVLWSALVALLQLYTDLHYTFFLVLISIIIIIYFFIKNRESIFLYIKYLSLLLVICIVFSLPILIPTLRFSKTYDAYQATRENYEPAMQYTDLRHYFPGPNYLNTQFGGTELKDRIEKDYKGGIRENNVFWGYTIIFLSLLGLFLSTLKNRYLYFSIAVLFFILSLGNYLYFEKALVLQEKLPYFYLAKTVFKNTDVVFSRFSIVTQLMLIVLACGFISYLVANTKFKKIAYLLYPTIFLLIAAEFYPVPMTLTYLKTPQVLKDISSQQGDFSVIILPSRMYYQTIISKPQLTGGLGRRAHDYYQDLGPYKNIPGIRLLYRIPNNPIDPNDEDNNQKLVHEECRKYNIKYIILDKDKTPAGEINDYKKVLSEILKFNVYYEDDVVAVYETKI